MNLGFSASSVVVNDTDSLDVFPIARAPSNLLAQAQSNFRVKFVSYALASEFVNVAYG